MKDKFDIDKMIKLAEKEIAEWTSFLKELKRQQAVKNNAGSSLPKRKS